ncbi:MAG: hypothetical protein LBI45_07260 [Bacteroidales bacterium]|jgi:hypothetical protein|nr:hypothetical protein [Bacteroidales bacterium]
MAQKILQIEASKMANILSRSVQNGMLEKFTIKATNNSDKIQKVALLGAFFDTMDYNASRTSAPINQSSTKELKDNGFSIAAIAFDGSTEVEPGVTIDFASGNPAATIQAFKRYIATNPRQLKSLLITTNNQDAFEASIELTKASPLGHGKMVNIDINQFFSPDQYQPDRVIIDFSDYPLEICDDLVMAVNIPAGATMNFNFRF